MKKLFYVILMLFSLILFFNVNGASATNSTTFSIDEVTNASTSVQSYVEANHQLPNNVTISGTTVNMTNYLKLETTAISNINNNITTAIPLGSYNNAISPSETITTTGNLTKTNYLTLANNVISFMNSNGRAPNYQTISLGNMRYESLVYTFSEILNSYRVGKALPDFIIVRPWTVVTNKSTAFITMGDISTAADTVQFYVESKHQLPDHVTISGSTVSMPQFLKLETTYLTYANGNLYQSITIGSYGTAPSPYETITGGNLEKADYITLANDIITFMDANGRAPNFKTTIRGSIRYESLVYIYAEILNSASRNLALPTYITLTPWTTVSNSNTVFVNMDQINTAVWTVKSNVETNHALPSNVTIAGRQVNMQDFLKLEIMSLKNIYAGLYQSIILQNYSPATSPSESVTSGKVNYENYMNVAENIRSYMDTNGRAPNYQSTGVGNIRFESLVYMYSQLINYYNANKALPQYITVNPWTVVTNPNTMTFNTGQIISGAETVVSYVETNHNLPTSITISGTTVSMAKFLKMALATVQNINGNLYGQIILENYSEPGSTSETITGGSLNKTDYLNLAKDVENFMYGNGRGPNFQNSSLGNIRYQSLVYMYSQILSSYKANNNTLPDLITIRPWSVISNTSMKFLTIEQIDTAAGTVKTYVETNHTLPSSVTINGTSVSMPKFLKLITTAVANVNGKLNATVVLQDYNTAPTPSETNTGGSLNSTDYLTLDNNIISFMDTNGRAPNYQTTSLGNIRYESLVFMFSQILNYYSTEKKLPQNITVDKWSVVSNANKPFFTVNQIKSAAGTVQSYVESNHALPTNVNISGTAVTMPQFLQLETTTVLNINKNLFTSLVLGTYDSPPSPSESITNRTFNKTDYLSLANDVIAFMYANGRAPNYKTTSHGNIQYQTLVYMFSQILNSNNATNTIPKSITITPWVTVSNSSTVLFTFDQIKSAAETVKSYVDTNHQLPNNVTISGRQVTMPQFLKLSAISTINIENYLKTSVILETVGAPTSPNENITSGTIYSGEFVDMANRIISYLDTHGNAPPNVTNTSLGSTMRYESLIYMFSKILISYNATEHPPDNVTVIPWLALSNPNGTFNFRTQEVFNSIQAAIDNADTINGDTIWLEKPTYTENIAINKKIILRPVSGFNVTVQASNPNLPVFTINSSGNGATIRDLNIKGSTSNSGIYINNSTKINILGNNITSNNNGLYLYNSTDNFISGNKILNNTLNGVFIDTGSGNEISGNEMTYNGYTGISIQNSNDNGIYNNNISNNHDGINLTNSSTEVHYNRIIGNSRFGLYNQGNGIVNATNNWWGSNNPIVSSTSPSDICITGGTVTYNPWLILILNSSTDRSDRSGTYYNYLITADLTHNSQGDDTSSDGNIPDNIPINFNSTLGSINSTATTKKGRVELKLNSTTPGTANVSVTLDNQTVSQAVNITSVNVLGIYNTRTHESFATIQKAVDDVDTRNGDTITLAEGTYSENVAINKKLTIQPVTGAKVTMKTDDPDKDAIILNNGGSGSIIQGLNIIGSSDSNGISLSHTFNVNINNNTILGSNKGIYLYQSGNNTINENTVKNNYYGIALYESTSNTISENIINNNQNGIYLGESNSNAITGSRMIDNWHGLYLILSSCNAISGNDIIGSWVGIRVFESNNNAINSNNLTDNGVGITYYDSIGITTSGNTFTNNWLSDTSTIDSSQMVVDTTTFSCGPAVLATVLRNLGIMTSEAEIATISGTDETGTSLLGLKTAAISKGATAVGVRISADLLQTNYIAVLTISGYNHFVIVQNITNNTVTLIDPSLGIIQMSREQFNTLYSGVALIINGSTPPGAIVLTDDEMQSIKANGHWESYYLYSYWIPIPYISYWEYIDFGGFWYPYCNFNWQTWQWESGWAWFDFGEMRIPIIDIYWQEIPVYGNVYVPDVEYQYNQARIIPSAKIAAELGALELGVGALIVGTGGTAAIALGVGSLSLGALGLGLDAYTGDLQKFWTDPWLRVTIDGRQIYPYPWW